MQQEIKTPWIVRRYRTTDKGRIFELYDAVHGRKKGDICRKNWVWEYEHNPYNASKPHVWVAECGDKIVSLHAAIPALLKCGDTEQRASWSVDLMTHPDFRYKGIFKEVTNKMMEESQQDGISIFLVLPNENSSPVLRKRGWFQISSVPHMFKPLRIWPLLKHFTTIRRVPKVFVGGLLHVRYLLSILGTSKYSRRHPPVKITEISSFDEHINSFFEETAKDYDIIVVRKRDYLNWRYAGCAHKKYKIFLAEKKDEILGYIILAAYQQEMKSGFIVDFRTKAGPNQQEVIELLLVAGIRYLRNENAESIELCALDGPYERILKRHGFAMFPEKWFWGYDLIGYAEPSEDCFGYIKDPKKKWFITMGDSDSDIIKG